MDGLVQLHAADVSNYPDGCNLIGRAEVREALCQGLIIFAASFLTPSLASSIYAFLIHTRSNKYLRDRVRRPFSPSSLDLLAPVLLVLLHFHLSSLSLFPIWQLHLPWTNRAWPSRNPKLYSSAVEAWAQSPPSISRQVAEQKYQRCYVPIMRLSHVTAST